MEIKLHPMGDYQTNCYIVTIDNKDIIIDLLDAWLEHNIEMFPANEQEAIRNLLIDRKAGGNISNRKPQ